MKGLLVELVVSFVKAELSRINIRRSTGKGFADHVEHPCLDAEIRL